MSTNLQLPHGLPQIRLPDIRIRASLTFTKAGSDSGGGGELESCKTPTSEESRIPQILSCPPAPRKPANRKVGLKCKRKLFDHGLQFFEIVNSDEIETFFRSSFDRISDSSPKRRCKCT